LLGIISGIVDLCKRSRKKPFAALGVVVGSPVFVGIVLVIVVGLTVD
jgi:hypothetical protein